MTEHEQDIKNLFDKATVPISPGMDHMGVKAISYDNFKVAIEKLMEKSFYYGKMDGLREARSIVDDVFIK